MWASRSYILPCRATPETRRWTTPRDPPSIGHPCALRRAPVHSPLGTRPGVRLPYSSTGYRGRSVGLFRQATPSGIEFISSASLFTIRVVTRMITDGRTDDRTMAAGPPVTWTHCSVRYEVTWGLNTRVRADAPPSPLLCYPRGREKNKKIKK
jgi:hypothetical protein